MTRPFWQSIRHAGLLLLATALVAGCAQEVPLSKQKSDSPVTADFPAAHYLQAEAQGRKILHVDSGQSLIVLEVRRAGVFARLGHDHVVASHDVKGFVAPDEGRADLSVPLDRLVVDEAALRAEAGFNTQPTPDDIAGTRNNMLNKVLDAERFPQALIRIVRKDGADDGADNGAGNGADNGADNSASVLNVAITLHGTTRTFDVPATIEETPDKMIVSGRMNFNQTDFGIVPFSILNGAIQVQDRLDMRFRIVAVVGGKRQ